ncbi:hypothetical protein I317_04686 [Kwoniella heveanensis CBS 569]|nr:hypothetical protein I317_04686 [Kwoniella heveanensis CBS 569]
MLVFAPLFLLLLWSAHAEEQKIPTPSVDCKSLDEFTCRYNCDMISIEPDVGFLKTRAELVEFQCLNGTTSFGLNGYGKEVMACTKCIVSDRVGLKVPASIKFWSNICDAAWNQSIDKAVEMLGESFNRWPGGYECGPDEEAISTTHQSTSRDPGTLRTSSEPTPTSSGTTDPSASTTRSASTTSQGIPGNGVPIADQDGNVSLGGNTNGDGKTGSAASRVTLGSEVKIFGWVGACVALAIMGVHLH